ncbi:Glu-tRNA(Gln) amidotransferase subunit GatE [Pyrobaculum aerophilum]|uniref:Glutamyl-tRNA(Gln) amidotransferase subunit E n=2 Tax=Pyrobaculum aerophilum TaxID=13773 RepID=GATE_PYRAE|nr:MULTISPECIES: Glu-tRNA(Gln) amidotransferase subunit GatE [Pyrobaculum]Q8ZTJ3.1 RecName: Full=Glutamyl-tRNA(Gln) amidotransferase subunit E; Short=Glu-ADT subunit E [Pyrobaculum aerophilum str. IM2]AAL64768.1 Glu-tRNA(Gln) amidotransferase subunit B (gatB) [Pyrobaculum aerophilum str. IM2]MCX8136278.1 Glu-tRNA(Gln) amidotransferase subunit GatE [Pyrobaculum aerophilum]HII47621.1 Glu-tRNA(Gln) amidotransferase subunit GatE [Pyrobaculum aerophilum]
MDYKALGLKTGLEIHIQLNTQRKLFCHCPPVLRDDEPHFRVERRLHISVSELGAVDPAVVWEVRKRRKYIYEGYRDTTCLVELDEEPPHLPDEEALVTAVAVAKMFNAKLFDEIYVMRKTVVDGSNVSGFQRTMLIAYGGRAKILGYDIGVETIALEEDAARKISEEGKAMVYRLDRLGIPLIEIATEPMAYTPQEVEEVAWIIGYSVKITGRAKRGVGTVRQDVNVSIAGGAKTEIKGVPDLSLIPKVIEYEAVRQVNLLKIAEELKRRGVGRVELSVADVTAAFANTKSRLVRKVLDSGGRVLALKTPGFQKLLGFEIQPGRRFGSELADYVRAWTELGGLLHSDELPGYGITAEEVREVANRLGVESFILLMGVEESELLEAAQVVVERLNMAPKGVPEETRAANPDGTTRFLRPRPGAARMYPETDLPPVKITFEIMKRAEEVAKINLDAKFKELISLGLSKDLALQLIKSPHLEKFEEYLDKFRSVPPQLIASILLNISKALAREGVEIDGAKIESVLDALNRRVITKEAVEEILRNMRPGESAEEVARRLGLVRLPYEEVKKIVEEVSRQTAKEKIIGEVMRRYRGRVDIEDVKRALAEIAS